MFNDISCGTKDNERECLANAKVVSLYAKRWGTGQWSPFHFAADHQTIETIFSHNCFCQSAQSYGAVAHMCEEYESHHDRSGRRDKVMGQSIVLSEIKTEVFFGE